MYTPWSRLCFWPEVPWASVLLGCDLNTLQHNAPSYSTLQYNRSMGQTSPFFVELPHQYTAPHCNTRALVLFGFPPKRTHHGLFLKRKKNLFLTRKQKPGGSFRKKQKNHSVLHNRTDSCAKEPCPQRALSQMRCHSLQQTATLCNTLQDTATHCNTLQHTATRCNTLKHAAKHCKTLQHTTTHLNTLLHTGPPVAL